MLRRFQNVWRGVLGSAIYICAAQHAVACSFHGYTPDPTLVDILLGSEHVVIARPDPSNPNRYVTIDALLGPGDAVDIPIPVDQKTRSKLESTPADTVLFARDGAYGPWLQLAVLDPNFRKIVDKVMQRQSAWIMGGDEERFQLFAGLLNDENPDVRRLALLELDQTDYQLLKDLRLPKIHNLQRALDENGDDLRPILILLAGLSQDRTLRTFMTAELDLAVRGSVPYMGAYATALIELNGAQAVRYVMDHHLTNEEQPIEIREKMLEAFAIQSQAGRKATRRAIETGVTDLLDQSPELAGAVARQFGARGNWNLAESLARARMKQLPISHEDIFVINQYIDIAEQSATASK